MKLKHIKLFENFEPTPALDKTMVFDWIPFDSMTNDPIQNTIPENLSYDELTQWVKESGSLDDVKNAGIFMSHNKIPGGGFNRVIVSNLSPLSMDLSIFNANYEKVNEYKNIVPSDIADVTKGASLLKNFGISSLDDDAQD